MPAAVGDYEDCNPLLSGPDAGKFACEGDGSVNCSCTAGSACACDSMFAPVGRQRTGNNGPSGPCSNYTHANCTIQNTQGDCGWNAKDNVCAPFSCENITATSGGKAMCDAEWECMWLDGQCSDYDCSKLPTPKECFNQSGSYPTGHFCKVQANGKCGGGWSRNDKTMDWRDTVFDMMNGYWYSTNAAGHCDEDSHSGDAEPCTWHIAKVEKVVNKSCVNDKIFSTILTKNSSCFDALPNGEGHNVSSDGYINCFFDSLLGNASAGRPGLAPTEQSISDEVAQLFEKGFLPEADGGCPWSGSAGDKQPAEPAAQVNTGVVEELLYVVSPKGAMQHAKSAAAAYTSVGAVLNNRNAADAPGLRAQLQAHGRGGALAEVAAAGRWAELGVVPESWLAAPLEQLEVAAVTVAYNTLFGQYSVCNPASDGYACNATWDCFCTSDWGESKGPYCKSHGDDDGDDCTCLKMGGCTPSKFGSDTAAITVGHMPLPEADGGGGGGGNLYAFQAGGACDGENEVCSWAVQEESLADIVVAPAECVSHSILVEKMAPTQAMDACHQ